jgi:large subunit ribosomal protein L6
MSRIGRQPIAVPSGVTVSIEPEEVRVNGPKGELSERIHRDIEVIQDGETLTVTRPTDRGEHRALHGLTRSLVANMVEGVTNGYEKRLEIQGVGYRAQLKGRNLELAVGYSHPVPIPAPDGIEFEVPQPTRVVVKGISKQLVGETAAIIRKQRPPEPYKGKGIRYEGEYVQRKVGRGPRYDRHHQREPTSQTASPRAGEDRGHRDASADLGVPLQPRPLRATDR